MKKIAITGALGHIGSQLIHSIKPSQFKKIILIDDLSTRRYCSLFNLPQNIPFQFIQDDICTADLNKYFKNIDIVIHLAAITDATSSVERPKEVEKVNFQGTQKVAQACIKNNCRLFLPSTTSVYGKQNAVVDETCPKKDLKPQSPYAASKLKSEEYLIRLGKRSKIKFFIGRLGTIFGPSIGMRFHTAVNKFIWQACMGEPLTVWKTAMHQKRAYLDLSDAVRAIKFIINKDLFNNQIYNLVTINTTISKIISSIRKNIPNLKIDYVDSEIMNQLTYTVENKKFKQAGFKFTGNLSQGVTQTIKMLKNA
jgi:nucleoside-diphosphate-sugar epimerase